MLVTLLSVACVGGLCWCLMDDGGVLGSWIRRGYDDGIGYDRYECLGFGAFITSILRCWRWAWRFSLASLISSRQFYVNSDPAAFQYARYEL